MCLIFSLLNDCTASCCRVNWTHWTWPLWFVPWTWTETSSLRQTDLEFCTTSWLVGSWAVHTLLMICLLMAFIHMISFKRRCFPPGCILFQVTRPHTQSISPWTKPQRSCAFCSRSTETCIRGSHSLSRWSKTKSSSIIYIYGFIALFIWVKDELKQAQSCPKWVHCVWTLEHSDIGTFSALKFQLQLFLRWLCCSFYIRSRFLHGSPAPATSDGVYSLL